MPEMTKIAPHIEIGHQLLTDCTQNADVDTASRDLHFHFHFNPTIPQSPYRAP